MPAWLASLGVVEFQDGRRFIGATFRGVPFHVESSELSGGRRTVRHEFPLRDTPYVEDMGRKGRAFPVDGYVLGESYLARRDALLAALEEEGPGELVHPYFGQRTVACVSFRVREATADGGLARFSLEFEETDSAPAFPVGTVAAEARVAEASDAAWAAQMAAFRLRYSVAGLPGSAFASLSESVRAASEALDKALAPIVEGTQALAALKRDLDNLVLDADALVRQPLDVVGEFAAVFTSLGTLPLRPSLGVRALLDAYGFTPLIDRPVATTATRLAEQVAYDALNGLIRVMAVVQAARLAVVESYDSYEAAVATRDAVAEKLDELLDAADDETFAALEQLRADLVKALPGIESDLPRLVSNSPGFTVPSLVLAHRIYGDVALEADLVTRNRVERPGFVMGGAALQVLTRG